MKKLSTLLIFLSCATLIACGKGQEINGHNTRTAYKSVKSIKNRLPTDKRIEFEVSFWTIRDAIKDNDEFLDKVDGKAPEEIIAIGKEIYQQRKNAGIAAYTQYSSWEEMIAKFGQERIDQERHTPKDPRDKSNDILYKL
ncbi:MAG: hypothetical protein M8364_11940 [Methylobacter sp.]|jgi:hypothetical protein|uniref:hypothetical protein n=1 Tax=Methylobacter TaxID=429 RepID=UPI00039AC6AF|nr:MULTISPECIES: hypothetical protein [Methylobacter]MCL7421604.1 hypothetical protein [Methylobacter sp.]